MQGIDGVAREALEQAILDHLAAPAQALFGGLEDQVQGAVEAALLCQVARRSQQDGGVPVVPAGVHLALVRAGIRQAGLLLDGQGVHVGAQAQHARAAAQAQRAYHAGAAQAPVHRVAPLGQARGHQVAGGEFLERQLGVRMDVMAQGHHLCLDGADAGQHGVGGAGAAVRVGLLARLLLLFVVSFGDLVHGSSSCGVRYAGKV